jgi:hypothetical protein
MNRARIFLLILSGLLLLLATGLSLWSGLHSTQERPWQTLAARVPMSIEGWVGVDLPLGETEAVRFQVDKLNYHDYLYRVYRKGEREVFVYAMYWRQGDISVREMSGHTPDGCWVANGAKHAIPQETSALTVGNRQSAPAEVREFTFPNGQHVRTAWWHIWGTNLVDRSFAKKSIMPAVKEIWAWMVKRRGARQDQLLVRIHSLTPLDEMVLTPPMIVFLNQFPEVFTATPLYAP